MNSVRFKLEAFSNDKPPDVEPPNEEPPNDEPPNDEPPRKKKRTASTSGNEKFGLQKYQHLYCPCPIF